MKVEEGWKRVSPGWKRILKWKVQAMEMWIFWRVWSVDLFGERTFGRVPPKSPADVGIILKWTCGCRGTEQTKRPMQVYT